MKYKNALISEIKASKAEICWCNVKLFSWYAYILSHLIAIPTLFAVAFNRYAPFLLPVIIFLCYKELNLIEDESHPINTKIKNIKIYKNETVCGLEKLKTKTTKPFENEQLSTFDTSKELKHSSRKSVTVHTLSSRNGYYKDVIEDVKENTELINKWLDKATGCLYRVVVYKNSEAESFFVTKEFFDTMYKQFEA